MVSVIDNATHGAGPVRLRSGATLATVVDLLIEVPVMTLVVKVVNASKGLYEARA